MTEGDLVGEYHGRLEVPETTRKRDCRGSVPVTSWPPTRDHVWEGLNTKVDNLTEDWFSDNTNRGMDKNDSIN